MKPDSFLFLRSPLFLLCLAVTAAMPFWLPSYYLGIATLALVYIGLALAWNIVAGIAGQMSLGHSVFVGIGALLSSALLLKLGINLWLGMLIAAAVSAALAAFIAWLDFRFRLSHLSFALITLAFAEMDSGGTRHRVPGRSVRALPAARQGQHPAVRVRRIARQFLSAVRDRRPVPARQPADPELAPRLFPARHARQRNAAQAIGVNLLRNKVLAMMVSAVLTSLVGTAWGRYSGFVDPYQMASPHVSVEVILFATIGGLGTVLGPLVGAGFLVAFGEIVRGKVGAVLPGLHFFIDGILIVLVILLMPRGVVPKLAELFGRRAPKRISPNCLRRRLLEQGALPNDKKNDAPHGRCGLVDTGPGDGRGQAPPAPSPRPSRSA